MKSWQVTAMLGSAWAICACARPTGDSGAALGRERLVSWPSSIAYVSSDRAFAGLPGEIRFGGPLGRSALYLKFPSEWRTRGAPQRAFVTLSAREGSAKPELPVTLEAWRISVDWQPRTLRRWSDKPSLAPPFARVRGSASTVHDLRIDVTELVRFAAQNPERDFGIAIIASGSDGPGETFSSGLDGGRAPQLELYLR